MKRNIRGIYDTKLCGQISPRFDLVQHFPGRQGFTIKEAVRRVGSILLDIYFFTEKTLEHRSFLLDELELS